MKHAMKKRRHQLSGNHAIVGPGFRLLTDVDHLLWGDQTACLSTLLSLEHHEPWRDLDDDWLPLYGMNIGAVCDETGDADGDERVFRRRQ